jgi:hypothetical protein
LLTGRAAFENGKMAKAVIAQIKEEGIVRLVLRNMLKEDNYKTNVCATLKERQRENDVLMKAKRAMVSPTKIYRKE